MRPAQPSFFGGMLGPVEQWSGQWPTSCFPEPLLSPSARASVRTCMQSLTPRSSPNATFELSRSTSPYEAGSSIFEGSLDQSGQLVVIPPYTTPPGQVTFQDFMWHLENPVPPSLTLAPEFEAVPFFFRNFVSLPQQAESMRGYLELLVPLYNQARPSSALHLATNAVALAACGNYPGRQDLLREAATTYGKALRKLNEDLKDPALSKSDESVLATLLFSLYEVSSMITSSRSSVVFLPLCAR